MKTTPTDDNDRYLVVRKNQVVSADLLSPGTPLQILHGDACYQLRITKQGKLILTK